MQVIVKLEKVNLEYIDPKIYIFIEYGKQTRQVPNSWFLSNKQIFIDIL